MRSFIWVFAFLLTIAATVYQWRSDPALPIKKEVNTGVRRFLAQFPATYVGTADYPVALRVSDISVHGFLLYRKYPTRDTLTKVDFKREGDQLVASIPNQPPAGTIEYQVHLEKAGKPLAVGYGKPMVIRFMGKVPDTVIISHVLIMFLALFFSNAAGMLALFKYPSFRLVTVVAFIVIFIGGFILGPIFQKYAFNGWWAGIPYSWGITDNKTTVAILAWTLALIMINKKGAAFWAIAASILTIAIFSVPHGFFG